MHWQEFVRGLQNLGVDILDQSPSRCFMCRGGATIQHIPKVEVLPDSIVKSVLKSFCFSEEELAAALATVENVEQHIRLDN